MNGNYGYGDGSYAGGPHGRGVENHPKTEVNMWSEPVQKLMDAAIRGYEECGVKPRREVTLRKEDGQLCGCLIGAAAVGLGMDTTDMNCLSPLDKCISFIKSKIPELFEKQFHPESDIVVGFDAPYSVMKQDSELTQMAKFVSEKYIP